MQRLMKCLPLETKCLKINVRFRIDKVYFLNVMLLPLKKKYVTYTAGGVANIATGFSVRPQYLIVNNKARLIMNLGLLKTQRYNNFVNCCEVKFVPRYFMLRQFEYLHFVEGEEPDVSMQRLHGTGRTQSVIP